LFLERDGRFQEIILPNGLPTHDDSQKRVVPTQKTVNRDELERHLIASIRGDSLEAPVIATGDRQLPIPDFDELRRLRDYEAENKKRKTLIHEIERRMR